MNQKSKKIFISSFIFIFLMGVAFFIFTYYKKPIANNNAKTVPIETKNSGDISGFAGIIDSVNGNNLKIHDKNQKETIVTVDDKTEYYKCYMDPIETKYIKAALTDLKKDTIVGISYNNDPENDDKNVSRVDLMIQNFIKGKVVGLNVNYFTLQDSEEKKYEINIPDKTNYYKQDLSSNVISQSDIPKPQKINKDVIKINSEVYVFLDDNIQPDKNIANSILINSK